MKPITVSTLNKYISDKLRKDINLSKIVIIGEISGFRKRAGRHLYFDLIDSESKISCTIWESQRYLIDENIIENGKSIIAVGSISPYAKNGTYSLNINHVEEKGKGSEQEAFEKLKRKLEEEGLFDIKYKKEIPSFPKCIGVITAANGAAVEDIKKSITYKNDYVNILIFDAIVQGENAPKSIINAIMLANMLNKNNKIKIDTLIVGRGGGSAEDLSCFNDENLARAIFSSNIPIISAVGHETDFTIADFVSDARANTPTGAGEMAVMNTFEIREDIISLKNYLNENIITKIKYERSLFQSFTELLYSNINVKLQNERSKLEKAELYLNENNPLNILSKGYSLVRNKNGNTISNINQIDIGEEYNVVIQDGNFDVRVISKEENDDE